MLNHRYLFLLLSCGLLSACNSETESAPAIITDTDEFKLLESNASQAINADLEVTLLAEGNQPTRGTTGPKTIVIYDNEVAFLDAWPEYMPKSMPLVDFSTHNILLYDRGESDLNACVNLTKVSQVAAEKVSDNALYVDIALEQSCHDVDRACAAVVQPGRPFGFYVIPKFNNTYISENLTIEQCD